MAELIPERLPSNASAGEKSVFQLLQNLPEDCLAYYEPVIENRYPDFIVILPRTGLLVIEVKGWYPKHIVGGDSHEIHIKRPAQETRERHPLRQAREYMYQLMDTCRERPDTESLLNQHGDHSGRFVFPFGHMAILNNITSEQLRQHELGDLSRLFPADKIICRDQLEAWLEAGLEGEALEAELKSCFKPWWPFPKLNEAQIDQLRSVIHPSIFVDRDPPKKPHGTGQRSLTEDDAIPLAVLDRRQEANVRSIGEGHRIIYGVAGSGKTTLLIARARLFSQRADRPPGLVLCFNVSLAAYLRHVLADCPNLKVLHFDGWAKRCGCTRQNDENNVSLGERLLKRLQSGCSDSEYYTAVFIDEAQDFEENWFRCALAAMADPDDGDLLIVGDGNQGLYGRRRVSWKQLGIKANGRVIWKRFDLDRNYRNTRKILTLAAQFSRGDADTTAEDSIAAITVDPTSCRREGRYVPLLVSATDRRNEMDQAVRLIGGLLAGRWQGETITPLRPEQIGVLYPYATRQQRPLLEYLVKVLQQQAPTVWLNRSASDRTRIHEPGIKIQTLHGAKGLQYKAVILMWSDLLPMPFGNIDVERDRRLLYVGLTRAEDYLTITASGTSPFVAEIEHSGEVDFVN